ncbi:MAG: hypothetical protein ABSD75_28710 [Terriglobales bacterium]
MEKTSAEGLAAKSVLKSSSPENAASTARYMPEILEHFAVDPTLPEA